MSALLQPDSDRFTGLGARPPVSVPDQFELQRLQRWLCHGSFRRAFYGSLGALHAPVGGKCSTVTLYVRETGGSSLLQAPWDCLNGPRGSSTYSPYMQREHARCLALAPPRGKCIEVRTLSRRDYGGQIVLAGPGSGQIRRPPPIEVGQYLKTAGPPMTLLGEARPRPRSPHRGQNPPERGSKPFSTNIGPHPCSATFPTPLHNPLNPRLELGSVCLLTVSCRTEISELFRCGFAVVVTQDADVKGIARTRHLGHARGSLKAHLGDLPGRARPGGNAISINSSLVERSEEAHPKTLNPFSEFLLVPPLVGLWQKESSRPYGARCLYPTTLTDIILKRKAAYYTVGFSERSFTTPSARWSPAGPGTSHGMRCRSKAPLTLGGVLPATITATPIFLLRLSSFCSWEGFFYCKSVNPVKGDVICWLKVLTRTMAR